MILNIDLFVEIFFQLLNCPNKNFIKESKHKDNCNYKEILNFKFFVYFTINFFSESK